MARPKSLRKVVKPPGFKGYKPYGHQQRRQKPVDLLYEEYEALKLADYDLMTHQEASEIMGISRATFARIYERARRKIARAFVEVKEIKAVYGHALLDKSWLVCNKCFARFTIPETITERNCPVCKSYNIETVK
ncbi:DUF134 domain-containing protein [Anaerophaga thermohalophila]|jgi:predicted DNA-binding protein (UPF0251 family)|uniref:DUF134 domain-containing protein n=1 Tax=Anaerophaga thermohalophila TaxID=177400 RepID=UPI0002E41205|nr:DUF134 domain-containing protein [Anaerophaga thermohalophila]MDN5291823.1 uncharacterized protein [Anaerophaga sp.]